MEKAKKRKVLIIIAIVVIVVIIAAIVTALYAGSKKTEAEDAALSHAGVTRQEASIIRSEIDFKGLSMACDVSFKTSDCDYEYEVSLPGLKILDFEKEYYGNSGQQSTSSAGSTQVPGTDSGTSVQQGGQTAAGAVAVSEAAAKETALAHAQVNESDLQFYRSYIDSEHGTSKYEIEFTAGGYDYDYEVDCTSGEILKFEKEKTIS